jgi:glutamate N-acetyltransferase / amino-acid N-acetyltransferase
LTGITKGAGMIRPDMATMLAYIMTDAAVSPEALAQMLQHATARSFNRITVDGDTSTNDAFVVAATGGAGAPLIEGPQSPGFDAVQTALTDIARLLAQYIVRDGEGATKFIEVCVEGGRNEAECLQVAYTIAESPLVKTAAFAGDPNWGRFCMAIGRSGIADLDTNGVSLWLDDVCVARGGLLADSYREEDGARVMAQDEFQVRVALGRGQAVERVWTSDFSYEYVRINAEYRT